MYAVAAHLPVIEYIPEWLTVMNQDDVDVDLNVAINDLSINNEIFNGDLTNEYLTMYIQYILIKYNLIYSIF